MSDSQTLGQFIQQRRHELGLTQESLAERLGDTVRQSEVSRLEHDRVSLPRRQKLELLAAALEVSLGDLLTRTGWMTAGDDLEQDLDAAARGLPLPDDLRAMTLQELVARLERIGEEQDQVTADAVDLEDAR